jgi:hypothetical protein
MDSLKAFGFCVIKETVILSGGHDYTYEEFKKENIG